MVVMSWSAIIIANFSFLFLKEQIKDIIIRTFCRIFCEMLISTHGHKSSKSAQNMLTTAGEERQCHAQAAARLAGRR